MLDLLIIPIALCAAGYLAWLFLRPGHAEKGCGSCGHCGGQASGLDSANSPTITPRVRLTTSISKGNRG